MQALEIPLLPIRLEDIYKGSKSFEVVLDGNMRGDKQ
jgi:hypothetical protein